MQSKRVYLDNAASTPMDERVFEAMKPYLLEQFGNPSSIHQHGRTLRAAIEGARKQLAARINAAPAEIVFTSGGTEADNQIIKGCVLGHGVQRIITSPLEHHAVLHAAESCAKHHSTEVVYLKPDSQGHLDIEELRALLQNSDKKTLVSLMHGNNEIGTLNDIHGMARLAKQHGALFHSDTVQTAGHEPLDMQELQADFIVASAHKFHGPKGVGFMFRREGLAVPSLICGGGQERNQRAGTESVAAIVGMAKAFELCYEDFKGHAGKLREVKTYAMARLQEAIPGVRFNGDTSEEGSLNTVLNVALPGEDEESLLLFNLDMHGISASGGSACTSGSVKASHVLTALGCSAAHMANSVRFSFGHQTSKVDIDYLCEKLALILPQPQKA